MFPTAKDANKWIYIPEYKAYVSILAFPIDPKNEEKGIGVSVSYGERELVNGKIPKDVLLAKVEGIYMTLKNYVEQEYENVAKCL